jgi:hypothetical protein
MLVYRAAAKATLDLDGWSLNRRDWDLALLCVMRLSDGIYVPLVDLQHATASTRISIRHPIGCNALAS